MTNCEETSKIHGWALRITSLIGNVIKRQARSKGDDILSQGKHIHISVDIIHYVVVFFMLMLLVFAQIESSKIRKEEALKKQNELTQSMILQRLLHGEKQERIPWPILHRQLTQIREGKNSLKSLFSLYQHVKVFYQNDWLLLIEIGNIITQNNNHSLAVKGNITDPMTFRHEVLQNLIFLKHGKSLSYVENPSNSKDQSLRIIEPPGKTFPQEIGPLIESVIEDVRKSTMPSDGFDV